MRAFQARLVRGSLVLLLCSLFSAGAGGQGATHGSRTRDLLNHPVLTVGLSHADLVTVLRLMGPGAGISYSDCHRADQSGCGDGRVVVLFTTRFSLDVDYPALVYVSLGSATLRVTEINVGFSSEGGATVAVPWHAVKEALGEPTRYVRQPLVLDDGGTEGRVLPCHDETGQVLSALYVPLGIQVFMSDLPSSLEPVTVSGFRRTTGIANGAEGFPPCTPQPLGAL